MTKELNITSTEVNGIEVKIGDRTLYGKVEEFVEVDGVVMQRSKIPVGCWPIELMCTAEGCKEKAVVDYNGHGAWACEYHDRKWEEFFEENYD